MKVEIVFLLKFDERPIMSVASMVMQTPEGLAFEPDMIDIMLQEVKRQLIPHLGNQEKIK